MARHLLTISIFCFICATHSPCASHVAIRNENLLQQEEYERLSDDLLVRSLESAQSEREKRESRIAADNDRQIVKRNSDSSSVKNSVIEDEYVRRIFAMYGNGDIMTIQGFEKLMDHLKLQGALNREKQEEEKRKKHSANELLADVNSTKNKSHMCINKDAVTALVRSESEHSSINDTQFYKACPILLYSIIAEDCADLEHLDEAVDETHTSSAMVWLCSIIAIIVISACGVLSLAIIPVMQKKFYKPLIQFLVALAVGTLAGDALLHLLPHAMTPSHHHGQSLEEHNHSHDENTQKGCMAMLGLTFFFIMERLISLFAKWRKETKRQRHSHVTVIKDRRESLNHKNNMQCVDKYNPIPFCYKDIMSSPHTIYDSDKTATTILDPSSNNSDMCKKAGTTACDDLESKECADLNVTTESNKMLTPEHRHEHEDYTVILREHKNDHHGHSHKHGHVHAAPRDLTSVAWMVIMGDGLHNFTDGMAIGAAFSAGLAGGFSTTVAVFCHELPHELGDFAMLLKAGMTIKQALFYNILSSVLCIVGNIAGLALGNTEYASSWVFAVAAGMFIYIALVDMIPELSSAHEDEGNLMQCVLHLGGLLLGFGIMALIALYEQDLKTLFNDPN